MAPQEENQIKDTKVEYENCCYSDQLLLSMQSATPDELLIAMFYLSQEYREEIKELKKRIDALEGKTWDQSYEEAMKNYPGMRLPPGRRRNALDFPS
jgi:hypothetical protein